MEKTFQTLTSFAFRFNVQNAKFILAQYCKFDCRDGKLPILKLGRGSGEN